MRLTLRDFQQTAVDRLYSFVLSARREAVEGVEQALILASPTGSGKTIIATALMERIVEGDDEHPGDADATFLWLTDQPDLNEQSRRKILAASTSFGFAEVQTIEADFNQQRLSPGKIYFLNIQKLSRGSHLITQRDDRKWTFWETITNTVQEAPGSLWLVLDEAHKGMLSAREAAEAASIVQKFVKGSAGEVPAVPLILGISATPQRFLDVLGTTARTTRPVPIDPEQVRASGLLKEKLVLYHPAESQPSDWSLLDAATGRLIRYAEYWAAYCESENEPRVNPVLVVQVEDAAENAVTRTDLDEAFRVLESNLGPLSNQDVAHCFQEGHTVAVGDRALRYVSPADIQDDQALKVVFFKMALNTGWDCPRAEVIMSFRRAVDYTRIAQLVGRLVRTPLAHTIASNDVLNSVSLFLPHYDTSAVNSVVEYLTSPETGVAVAPEVVDASEIVELVRDDSKSQLFGVAGTLPTYTVERARRTTNVRRLMQLGRLLNHDHLDHAAPATFKDLIVSALDAERSRLMRTPRFRLAVQEWGQIGIRVVTVPYWEGEEQEEMQVIGTARRNLEDVFDRAGRKLGEGLHKLYLKARVAASDGAVRPAQAKLELTALLANERTRGKLERASGERFNEEYDRHRVAIRALSEPQRERYRKLQGMADTPQYDYLELPHVYSAPAGDDSFAGHLYSDSTGGFATRLSGLERRLLDLELRRPDTLGWFRNLPRKKWSLTIPYKNGADKPLYPDFLLFRGHGGSVTVDLLEPHALAYADSAAKAKGLAEYAARHGDLFGRIEMVIEESGRLLHLDVNQRAVREKALALSTSENLRQLFASEGYS